MKFNFKAKTPEGKYEQGSINASTREAAIAILQRSNLMPLSLKAEGERLGFFESLLKYYESVNEKERMIFFRQLAILVGARVPIVVSLSAVKEQTDNKYFIQVINEMIGDVEDGTSFSSAMEKHKNVFSNLSVNIIRAGETSGNLKKSIDYVADNIERNYALTSRVRSALIYPTIVLTVFFIIGFLAISFIIPKLTAIIKEMNAVVPWYTQLTIVIGDFMAAYWWAVATVILAFFGAIFYYIKTDDGQEEWDHLKIKLPIIGPIYRFVYITRFAENLAVLLTGGIPIIKSLLVVSNVVDNSVFRDIFVRASEEIKKGGNMSTVLKREELIPPIVAQMVKIGEESGQIDIVLGHVAKFYDREVENITKNLSSLIEPILMVIIGIAVGFMAFAILMPIYNIAGQIQ